MNIDTTDTQWSGEGVLTTKKTKLTCKASWATRKAKISHPEYYDPRVWLRAGQTDDRSSGKSIPGTERDQTFCKIFLSPAYLKARFGVFFRQKQGDTDESVTIVKLCFYCLPACQTARRGAAMYPFESVERILNGRFGYWLDGINGAGGWLVANQELLLSYGKT